MRAWGTAANTHTSIAIAHTHTQHTHTLTHTLTHTTHTHTHTQSIEGDRRAYQESAQAAAKTNSQKINEMRKENKALVARLRSLKVCGCTCTHTHMHSDIEIHFHTVIQ